MPDTGVDMLPGRKFESSVSESSKGSERNFLEEFRPEALHFENLAEKDVSLGVSSGPLVELAEQFRMHSIVVQRFSRDHSQSGSNQAVRQLVLGVCVGWGLPSRH